MDTDHVSQLVPAQLVAQMAQERRSESAYHDRFHENGLKAVPRVGPLQSGENMALCCSARLAMLHMEDAVEDTVSYS